jgi:hypothetical protein
LTLSPESLDDLFSDIVRVGEALGAQNRQAISSELKKRCEHIVNQCDALSISHTKTRPNIVPRPY